MFTQVRGFQCTRGCQAESCSGSVATAGSPPSLVRFTASKGSQLAFSSPTLMSLADPRQTPQGIGVWQGMGEGSEARVREKERDGESREERERERTSLMRSVIHRHPGGHTLERGNTTHVLTGLALISFGLPRLREAPSERVPRNHHCLLLDAAHIGEEGISIQSYSVLICSWRGPICWEKTHTFDACLFCYYVALNFPQFSPSWSVENVQRQIFKWKKFCSNVLKYSHPPSAINPVWCQLLP